MTGPQVERLAWREIEAPIPGWKCWQRDLHDGNLHAGHLSVLLSHDPDGWHMSISHRIQTSTGIVPGRYPTWDEIKDARYRFCPDDVTMAMLLPPSSEYVNLHETTFHLWEVPSGEGA